MRAEEITQNEISPELQQLIDAATATGNKMAASKTHRYQLYMPKFDRTALGEDFKPNAKLWTSTAISQGPKTYTSEWADWCVQNMPRWVSPTGSLYQIQPGARVLNLGSDAAAERVAKLFGKDYSGLSRYAKLSDYPWESLGKYFDGVRYPARIKRRFDNILMSLWDVESTAWYNTDVLKLVGEVKIQPREWRTNYAGD